MTASLLVALLLGLGCSHSPGVAIPRGPTLTRAAAQLGAITGGPVQIHATSLISADKSLPLICKTVIEAFRDAAKDPVTQDHLGRIVHVVVIQGWFAGAGMHHVKLNDEVLTIQTLTTPADIQDLRPLIVEVLKKVAQLDAKRSG
jgi:hypothetical protein